MAAVSPMHLDYCDDDLFKDLHLMLTLEAALQMRTVAICQLMGTMMRHSVNWEMPQMIPMDHQNLIQGLLRMWLWRIVWELQLWITSKWVAEGTGGKKWHGSFSVFKQFWSVWKIKHRENKTKIHLVCFERLYRKTLQKQCQWLSTPSWLECVRVHIIGC